MTVKFVSSENVTDNHTVSDGTKYMIGLFLENGYYQITRRKNTNWSTRAKAIFIREYFVLSFVNESDLNGYLLAMLSILAWSLSIEQ